MDTSPPTNSPERTLLLQNVQPWSANATFWIGCLILLAYLVLTGLNLSITAGFQAGYSAESAEQVEQLTSELMQTLALDGDFNAGNYVVLTFVFAPIMLWFGKQRSTSTGAHYLGFGVLPSKKLFLQFNGLLVGYFILSYFATEWLDIETPQSMIELYNSTNYYWLALLAIVICAPVLEEMFFRGFLYKGWQASRLGVSGTIVLTSILFTIIHAGQYDLSVLAILSVLALLLGVARYKSGGLWLPIYLHFINNVYAAIEMYLYMN